MNNIDFDDAIEIDEPEDLNTNILKRAGINY
jgi:hypothetical protein